MVVKHDGDTTRVSRDALEGIEEILIREATIEALCT
jgi:hypothetical protein